MQNDFSAGGENIQKLSRRCGIARKQSNPPHVYSVLLCVVQNGTERNDTLKAVAADKNGRFLMAGTTAGGWAGFNNGGIDFAAILFDAQSTLPPTPSPITFSSTAGLPGLTPTRSPTMSPSTTGLPGLMPSLSPTTSPSSIGPAGVSFSTATIAVVVAAVVAVATAVLAVCMWRRIKRPNDEGRHLAREVHASQMSRSHVLDLSKGVILPTDNNYGPNVADKSMATPPVPPENALELAKSAASAGRNDSTKIVKVDGQDHVTVKGAAMFTSTMATPMESVALRRDRLPCDPPVDIIPETTISESVVTNVLVSRNSIGGAVFGGVGISAAEAVMEAASAVASSSSIPGVSEAARLVSVLVKLVVEKEDGNPAGDWRVRWCRSIVAVLERASNLTEEVSEMSARMRRLSNAKYGLKTVFFSRQMNAFRKRNIFAKKDPFSEVYRTKLFAEKR